jgi:hypothetical protein
MKKIKKIGVKREKVPRDVRQVDALKPHTTVIPGVKAQNLGLGGGNLSSPYTLASVRKADATHPRVFDKRLRGVM